MINYEYLKLCAGVENLTCVNVIDVCSYLGISWKEYQMYRKDMKVMERDGQEFVDKEGIDYLDKKHHDRIDDIKFDLMWKMEECRREGKDVVMPWVKWLGDIHQNDGVSLFYYMPHKKQNKLINGQGNEILGNELGVKPCYAA